MYLYISIYIYLSLYYTHTHYLPSLSTEHIKRTSQRSVQDARGVLGSHARCLRVGLRQPAVAQARCAVRGDTPGESPGIFRGRIDKNKDLGCKKHVRICQSFFHREVGVHRLKLNLGVVGCMADRQVAGTCLRSRKPQFVWIPNDTTIVSRVCLQSRPRPVWVNLPRTTLITSHRGLRQLKGRS